MESVGIYAKTDVIDAKALADYAAINQEWLQPFHLPEPEEIKPLRQWNRRRDDLVKQRTQESNRLQSPDNADLRSSFEAIIACLDQEIARAEATIKTVLEQSSALMAKLEVLTTVKGVGVVTAVRLLAAMPELGTLNGKQAASMAGLAPFPRDSGKRKGYRRTRAGRVEIRDALYMAALSASRYNSELKAFYDRLRQNGKKPMQAMIAVARKLLVILNAKMRDAATGMMSTASA